MIELLHERQIETLLYDSVQLLLLSEEQSQRLENSSSLARSSIIASTGGYRQFMFGLYGAAKYAI